MRLSRFFVTIVCRKSLLASLFFSAIIVGADAASSALACPVLMAPGCKELFSIKFTLPFTLLSVVGVIVATPGGLPTLSGFSAIISAG